ncbi:hypothetical protein cypCar_00023595 [Cyprinus carpio]|nr:hypothetical protein cypCar_00023595 [Cyprinus carpio]
MAEGSKSDAPIRERVHVPSALRKKRQEYQQGNRSHAGNLTRFPMRPSRYTGSKSMGDITLEPIPQESDNCSSFDPLGSHHVHQRSVGEVTLEPSAIQRVQQEQLQSIRDRIKESEAKWHEDLNRWKNRRRSANFDLHRKREEREQIELTTDGGGASAIRTAQLTGVPEESSNMPGPMSDAGSSVSSTAWSTTLASPFTNGTSFALTKGTDAETTDSSGEFFTPPAAVVSEPSSLTSQATGDPDLYEQQGPDFSHRAILLESFYAGGARISATLPRGFRRSEGSSRLSTGVTPRPFGTKPSKVSSLPRAYSMDDSHKSLISGNGDNSIIPSFLSGQGKVTASVDKGHSRSSTHPINPKKEEDERRDRRSSAPPINCFVTKVTMAASNMQTSSPVVAEIRDVKGVLSKTVNGHSQDNPVALRNTDYENIVLKNNRRKLEFFMQQGGSESAISDLQVPSISTTSSRCSWDHEEERRRQEKWQMEQERLLQEKYRRDQEKLEEEWRRAQQEVYGEEHSGTEEQRCPDVLSNGNTTNIPPSSFNQFIATTSVASSQNADKVGETQNRQTAVQTAARQHSLKAEVECDSTTKSPWTKSKSTPALQGLHKQDAKGSGKKKGQLSQTEKERLQILEEMRKKTQLLTDNSWIRQRNASFNKEPITGGTSVRRYESLDNLLTTNSWSRQSHTSSITSRPHSALGHNGTYRSGRSSLSPGSAIFSTGLKQSSNVLTPPITTTPELSGPESCPNSQQRGRISLYLTFNPSVSAAGLTLGEGLSPELMSESDTDSSSVTAATAESESVPPSPIDQNALQQILEECTTEAASGITTISTT